MQCTIKIFIFPINWYFEVKIFSFQPAMLAAKHNLGLLVILVISISGSLHAKPRHFLVELDDKEIGSADTAQDKKEAEDILTEQESIK